MCSWSRYHHPQDRPLLSLPHEANFSRLFLFIRAHATPPPSPFHSFLRHAAVPSPLPFPLSCPVSPFFLSSLNSRSMEVADMVVRTGLAAKQSAKMTRKPRSKGAAPVSPRRRSHAQVSLSLSLSLPRVSLRRDDVGGLAPFLRDGGVCEALLPL